MNIFSDELDTIVETEWKIILFIQFFFLIGWIWQLFKNRHVMVRVGGGWDTLEHYLLRHDPCRRSEGHHHGSHSRSPTPESVRPRLSAANASGSSLLGGSTPCLTNDVIIY